MRQFIRHPTDIPIEFQPAATIEIGHKALKNYSEGGLCFFTDSWVEPDTEINVAIPVTPPPFHALASVVWCKTVQGKFEVGIRFLDVEAEYTTRMIEQLSQIEEYKQHVLAKEGRSLTGEEAVLEWIEKYADGFQDDIN